jgi:hypothetical protein
VVADRFSAAARHFYRPAQGPTQLPIKWVPGADSPGIRRLGREALPSPSADVYNCELNDSIPSCLHGVVLN